MRCCCCKKRRGSFRSVLKKIFRPRLHGFKDAGYPVKASKIKDIGHELLTPREQEILRLLAEGHSARKIAEKLCISPRTAENHRTHIMKKLGLHSTLDLVRYAARIGLIDLDLWIEKTH